MATGAIPFSARFGCRGRSTRSFNRSGRESRMVQEHAPGNPKAGGSRDHRSLDRDRGFGSVLAFFLADDTNSRPIRPLSGGIIMEWWARSKGHSLSIGAVHTAKYLILIAIQPRSLPFYRRGGRQRGTSFNEWPRLLRDPFRSPFFL